jgi:hypothetical protein
MVGDSGMVAREAFSILCLTNPSANRASTQAQEAEEITSFLSRERDSPLPPQLSEYRSPQRFQPR